MKFKNLETSLFGPNNAAKGHCTNARTKANVQQIVNYICPRRLDVILISIIIMQHASITEEVSKLHSYAAVGSLYPTRLPLLFGLPLLLHVLSKIEENRIYSNKNFN